MDEGGDLAAELLESNLLSGFIHLPVSIAATRRTLHCSLYCNTTVSTMVARRTDGAFYVIHLAMVNNTLLHLSDVLLRCITPQASCL